MVNKNKWKGGYIIDKISHLTKNETLPVKTAIKIKEMIIKNNMMPGDRLPSETELIQAYNVSRSTLREAMKSLSAENIVEIKRGNGTFVSKNFGVAKDPFGIAFSNSPDLIEDLLEARLLIEPQVAVLAVAKATKKDLTKLEGIINELNKIDGNSKVANELDIEFHLALAKCTKNNVLSRIVPIIIDSICLGYTETVNITESFDKAKRLHTKIYEAILNKDVLAAKYYSERHVRETMNDIKEMRVKK